MLRHVDGDLFNEASGGNMGYLDVLLEVRISGLFHPNKNTISK